jgi:hypothetical protein
MNPQYINRIPVPNIKSQGNPADRLPPASESREVRLRHVARMIRHRRVAIRLRIEPDLVAAGSLPIEFKARAFSLWTTSLYRNPARRPILAAGSRSHHNRVIATLCSGRQIETAATITPGFNDFLGDIPGDIECFCDSAALRDEAAQFVRSGKKQSLRHLHDLDL